MREVPMLPFQRLDVYVVAKALAKLVNDAKISDRELREQATDAAKSTFLRLCEGLPLEGVAMRNKYFNESHASLFETLGAVDLAVSIGVMREADGVTAQELGVRLKAMLRRLMHSK